MGYGEAPWTFKGRALYQLQLVKTEDARKHIPENFKLVELFGYTLGGFYLARYDDSPVGSFDELVALAGLVWNAPTSCAWAARVYVNNREARDHGLKSVGLPSRLARFNIKSPGQGESSSSSSNSKDIGSQSPCWWWQQGAQKGTTAGQGGLDSGSLCISNVDTARGRGLQLPVCTLALPLARQQGTWAGPRIRLALPSFSGGTPDYPALIQYSCDLMTNVRAVQPAIVSVLEESSSSSGSSADGKKSSCELMSSVLGGRPLVALAFDDMVMTVEEPTVYKLPAGEASNKRGFLFGMVPPALGSS